MSLLDIRGCPHPLDCGRAKTSVFLHDEQQVQERSDEANKTPHLAEFKPKVAFAAL